MEANHASGAVAQANCFQGVWLYIHGNVRIIASVIRFLRFKAQSPAVPFDWVTETVI